MIRNDTGQDFQLRLRVGETHLEGEWRSEQPPQYSYQILERNARIDQASWGGYIRHNQLYRQVFDASGRLLDEHTLFDNDAIMMYSPLLPQ